MRLSCACSWRVRSKFVAGARLQKRQGLNLILSWRGHERIHCHPRTSTAPAVPVLFSSRPPYLFFLSVVRDSPKSAWNSRQQLLLILSTILRTEQSPRCERNRNRKDQKIVSNIFHTGLSPRPTVRRSTSTSSARACSWPRRTTTWPSMATLTPRTSMYTSPYLSLQIMY
jgi:hypothetical protein